MQDESDKHVFDELSGPLPVCDYTGEPTDEPCEEPATVKTWSSAAVITAASVGSVVGGILMAVALVWALGMWPGVRPASDVQPATLPSQVEIVPTDDVNTAVAVALKVTPSVANVRIEQETYNPLTGVRRFVDAGNGSGVIVREDGHVLTNYHVIEAADRIVVTVGVQDLEASVVGVDPSTDLAVLKVEGSGYPAIQIGSSAEIEVGEFVVAVGSPFGLEKSVTSGIVSAVQRSSFVEGSSDIAAYTNLIQTDAAINPGNSGGALVDNEGRLIGINTLIQSAAASAGTVQSAGIGFAIPVDFAMSVAEQLIETGTAIHPYMGVRTSTIDEAMAAQFGLGYARGALVMFVEPDSPAEAGGIERGDIITQVGERDIGGIEDVFAAVRAYGIDETVEVVVVRADTERTLSVTLGSDSQRP